jgi:hypothetical protein
LNPASSMCASTPQTEGFSGTYTVAADHIVINDAIKARWLFDGRTLTFTEVAGGPDDIAVWGSHPWTWCIGDSLTNEERDFSLVTVLITNDQAANCGHGPVVRDLYC